jgi:hypothetical protein
MKKIAVVTGSSLWEILRGPRRSGLPTTQGGLPIVRDAVAQQISRVHLYWKSPSALHFHKLRILRKDQDALLRERSVYESSLAVSNISCKKTLKELTCRFWTCTRRTIYRGRGRGRDGCPHFRDEISALLLSYWRDLDVNGSYERLSG